MNKLACFICLLILLIYFNACSVQPRYRTGDAKRPGTETKQPPKQVKYAYGREKRVLSTNELIRLGIVIDSYLGKPYKGKSASQKGLDCSQLTAEVFKKFNGSKLPYSSKKQFQMGHKVSRQKMQFGDLVFFRTEGSKISHVGIFIENDEFVHASSSNGVIISSIKEDYWEKRFAGCRRILP